MVRGQLSVVGHCDLVIGYYSNLPSCRRVTDRPWRAVVVNLRREFWNFPILKVEA